MSKINLVEISKVFFKKITFHYWLILALLFTIPSFYSLIKPGYFPMQDDMQAFRLFEMDKCFTDLQIPCRWVPDAGYGYGYPQFNFYAPGVYYFGQAIKSLGFQYIDTVKILFVLGFIAASLFMFILINEFFGPFPAFVSAILYTYAPYKAAEVYVRGSLSEFWGIVFFPLLFWSSYKLIKNGGEKYFLLFSVSTFLLLVTHNVLPMIILPVLGLWILFFLFSEKAWVKIPNLFLCFLTGVGLSAFFILPLIFERKFIHSETLLSGYFDYRRHFIDLKQMFLSNTWGFGSSELGPNDNLALSSGRALLLGGLLAIIYAILKFKKERKISALVFLLFFITLTVLFMMHLKSSFVWSAIPVLPWLQFPWRFLSDSLLLLSFITAAGIYLSGKLKYIFGLTLVFLTFFWHGSFFRPQKWLNITDEQKFTGEAWEKQLTASIGDYLPVSAEFPPNLKASDLPEVLDGKAEIKQFVKGSYFQKTEVDVSEDATIRMPFFDFPGIIVNNNGNKIEYRNNDCRGEDYCFGLITFSLKKGINNVEVVLKNTPVRNAGNLISLSSLLFLFVTVKGRKYEEDN